MIPAFMEKPAKEREECDHKERFSRVAGSGKQKRSGPDIERDDPKRTNIVDNCVMIK